MANSMDYNAAAPEAVRPLFEVGKALAKSSLEKNLLTLVELRASQINGCGVCLAIHMREAQAQGESLDRIVGLNAWQDAGWYNPRERAALEWTDALTKLSQGRPPEDLLARMREHFDDRELVFLTLAVTAINSWNRFNVAFGQPSEAGIKVFEALYPSALQHA